MDDKKVLIVDDDEMIRRQLGEALQRNFFNTMHAGSGEEALEIVQKEKVDVLLVDVKLPGMNGLELLRKVKVQSPTTEVIIITGFGNQEIAIQALRQGAIDYIEKPVVMDELNAALGRAIESMREKQDLVYENTILIVDDEETPLRRLKRSLDKENYSTFTATNGMDGLEIINNNKIDVVITDIKMPGIDGLELLSRAKKMYPDIEVIVITGHGDQEVAVSALRAGAIDYLCKPIDLDELLLSVNKTVERIGLNRTSLYRNRELKLSKEIVSKMNEELERKVTERTEKLSETQSQLMHTSKLATLGEMSAGLAHEMNQPLNSIALTSENLRRMKDRDKLTDEKLGRALEDIEGSVRRMARIINHIRIFARQESLKFSEIEVTEPIEGALSLLGQQLRTHGINVIEEYADDLPKITGEPYQLEQVITNAISNARHAMEEREEKKIEGYKKELIFRTARRNGDVCISLTDNGSGMTDEQKEKMFQPFFTTKAVGKSTGLGMSISFGIIESHHGSIEVDSELGKGTTVSLILPLKQPEKSEE